jgi:hypothetical protein
VIQILGDVSPKNKQPGYFLQTILFMGREGEGGTRMKHFRHVIQDEDSLMLELQKQIL